MAQTSGKKQAEGHPEEHVLEAKPRTSKRREWSLLSNGKSSHIKAEMCGWPPKPSFSRMDLVQEKGGLGRI